MALGTAYPFGLRRVQIQEIAGTELETPIGTAKNLPASRVFSFTESEDYEELRGDDKVITSRGTGAAVEWELEGGGIDLDIYRIIAGGTLSETGTTPNQVKKVAKKATDSRPFFMITGWAINDNLGNTKVILYRCRATGDIEGEFSDGSFYLTQASGTAFPSQKVATLDALYDIIFNENPALT